MRQALKLFDATNDFGAVALHVGGDDVGLLDFQVEKRFDEVAVDEIPRRIALAAKRVAE